MQSYSNLEKDKNVFERVSWGYTILHDMRLVKIIKHVICDMIEVSWNFLENISFVNISKS